MDPERRYFAELLEWVRHEERILAVHQARPGWAAVNSSAAWIVQFCEAPDGRTLEEIREGFAQRFGPVSDEEVSAWLDALEGGGLLSQGSERSAATALEPRRTRATGSSTSTSSSSRVAISSVSIATWKAPPSATRS